MGLLVATVSMEHAAALAAQGQGRDVAGATEPHTVAVAAAVAATVPAAAGAAASAGAPVGAALPRTSPPPPPPPPPRARLRVHRAAASCWADRHARTRSCRRFCAHSTATPRLAPPTFTGTPTGATRCARPASAAPRASAPVGAECRRPGRCAGAPLFRASTTKRRRATSAAARAGGRRSTPCTPAQRQRLCVRGLPGVVHQGGKTAAAASTCTYCKCRACAICTAVSSTGRACRASPRAQRCGRPGAPLTACI